MPPNRDPVYLWDILHAARGVVAAVQNLSFLEYVEDENLRLAVERRIEIIGEAARRLSGGFKEAHPEIPWRRMIDQRNVLIHTYEEVADDRIWELAKVEIPRLIEQLAEFLPPPPDLAE